MRGFFLKFDVYCMHAKARDSCVRARLLSVRVGDVPLRVRPDFFSGCILFALRFSRRVFHDDARGLFHARIFFSAHGKRRPGRDSDSLNGHIPA